MDIELHPLPSSINQDSDEGTNHDSSDGWTDEYTDDDTDGDVDDNTSHYSGFFTKPRSKLSR
jgi:hypothetical protein